MPSRQGAPGWYRGHAFKGEVIGISQLMRWKGIQSELNHWANQVECSVSLNLTALSLVQILDHNVANGGLVRAVWFIVDRKYFLVYFDFLGMWIHKRKMKKRTVLLCAETWPICWQPTLMSAVVLLESKLIVGNSETSVWAQASLPKNPTRSWFPSEDLQDCQYGKDRHQEWLWWPNIFFCCCVN